MYKWNNVEKRHDVIHEYDDGTSEVIPRDDPTPTKKRDSKPPKEESEKQNASDIVSVK